MITNKINGEFGDIRKKNNNIKEIKIIIKKWGKFQNKNLHNILNKNEKINKNLISLNIKNIINILLDDNYNLNENENNSNKNENYINKNENENNNNIINKNEENKKINEIENFLINKKKIKKKIKTILKNFKFIYKFIKKKKDNNDMKELKKLLKRFKKLKLKKILKKFFYESYYSSIQSILHNDFRTDHFCFYKKKLFIIDWQNLCFGFFLKI
jgi:hypothetical protein